MFWLKQLVKQKGNLVVGNQAGRDNNITTNVVSSPITPIGALNKKYLNGPTASLSDNEFLETLQHYVARSVDPDVRGLAAKLADADRSEIIEWAEGLKERMAKRIMRFQTSAAAQDIFGFILSDLHTKFQLAVWPHIQKGADRPIIDSLIQDKVIQPVLSSLEDNVLGLSATDLLGLVFFLGGNCHIRWDKC